MRVRERSSGRRARLRLVVALALLVPGAVLSLASPATAASAISVTPSTGLVDGQTVHLSISGFAPNVFVGVAQCVDDFDYYQHCNGVQGQTVSAAGTLEVDLPVWAVVETSAFGSVDCRNPGGHTCVIGVNTQPVVDGSAIATLDFDPGGALLPTPPIAVTPATDLANDQPVFVTGADFTPGGYNNAILQCQSGNTSTDACSTTPPPGLLQGPNNPDGTFVAALRVRSVITTGTGNVDCRTAPGACEIRVFSYRSGRTVQSNAAISFAPGASVPALPSITANPSSALTDFQAIHIEGAGFPISTDAPIVVPTSATADPATKVALPYPTASVSQCSTTAPVVCVSLGYGTTYDDGSIEADVAVRASLWQSSSQAPLDCRPAAGLCQIVVTTQSYAPQPSTAFAPITFTPGTPLAPPPTLTATPDTGLVDHQVVDVAGAGYQRLTPPIYPGVEASQPLRTDPVTGREVPDIAAWNARIEAAKTAGPTATTGIDRPAAEGDWYTTVMQCQTGIAGYAGCDQSTATVVEVSAAGDLTGRVQVEAIITRGSSSGLVTTDCRATACELRTATSDDPQLLGVAPLAFQPGGPLAPPPALTLVPDTDLRDGQQIEVHGTGFPWRGPSQPAVAFSVCRHDFDVSSGSACDNGVTGNAYATPAEDGSFVVSMPVRATILTYTYDGQGYYQPITTDCRVDPCDLVAAVPSSYEPEQVAAPLDFDPDAPLQGPPTAAASRGADLPETAAIEVSFSNFSSGQQVRIVQCRDSGPLTMLTCDNSNSVLVSTGTYGEGTAPFTVRRYLTLSDGTSVDCASTWCPVMVEGQVSAELAAAYVWFAGTGGPPNPPPTNPPPTTPPIVNPRFTG